MIYGFGPRARAVYVRLREQIEQGELPPNTKLPPLPDLAAKFGVAPLTMRQVLGQLVADDLIVRTRGRGTFVLLPAPSPERPAVLIVDDDPRFCSLLAARVRQMGHRPLVVNDPSEALTQIESDEPIGLILSDIRMPTPDVGVAFIRTVRRRWPELPLAAVTGYPADLIELHGTPECPVLILTKPVWRQQLQEALRLAVGREDRASVPTGRTAARRVSARTSLHGYELREALEDTATGDLAAVEAILRGAIAELRQHVLSGAFAPQIDELARALQAIQLMEDRH